MKIWEASETPFSIYVLYNFQTKGHQVVLQLKKTVPRLLVKTCPLLCKHNIWCVVTGSWCPQRIWVLLAHLWSLSILGWNFSMPALFGMMTVSMGSKTLCNRSQFCCMFSPQQEGVKGRRVLLHLGRRVVQRQKLRQKNSVLGSSWVHCFVKN